MTKILEESSECKGYLVNLKPVTSVSHIIYNDGPKKHYTSLSFCKNPLISNNTNHFSKFFLNLLHKVGKYYFKIIMHRSLLALGKGYLSYCLSYHLLAL